MGFIKGLLGATVKTVLTPVAILKDVANVVTGEEVDTTANLLGSVVEDIIDAADDLSEGDL